jgi:hypothetical protein
VSVHVLWTGMSRITYRSVFFTMMGTEPYFSTHDCHEKQKLNLDVLIPIGIREVCELPHH